MADDPIKKLVTELGTDLSQNRHADRIFGDDKSRYPIEPSRFTEIKPAKNPRKIAFIDGGDGPLEESPSHLISINRVYYSIFQGRKRIRPKTKPRIQFWSYVKLTVSGKDGRHIRYDTRVFPYEPKDGKFLPDDADLASDASKTTVLQETKLSSLARRFAEWRMAIHVVNTELERGDMLVIDGSLNTRFKNETTRSRELYDAAKDKGVIVCGLAKTSRLITASGEPLMARVAEISKEVPYQRWFIKVAQKISADDMGFIMVAKFHPKSQFVYRFEILDEQFEELDEGELNHILASLAENSNDVAMPGYPYGAIDADRFAQVRLDELNMYKGFIMSEKIKRPEWRQLQKYASSGTAHDVLNEVTS